ncbi:hypothetical protein BZA77DRAFT_156699 [Pyronema omphalodes]|nr:hypothetical protein BZA77DRAFT_156699 [Pyronema omphalodes]
MDSPRYQPLNTPHNGTGIVVSFLFFLSFCLFVFFRFWLLACLFGFWFLFACLQVSLVVFVCLLACLFGFCFLFFCFAF